MITNRLLSSPGKIWKVILLCIILVSGAFSSCYDDTELMSQLQQVEQRVSTLETLMKAVQAHDMISSIVPVDNGYLITFKNAGIVTLYNGKNGKDGKDGVDGQDGKNGTDGQDGKDGANGKDGKDGDSFFKSVEIGDTSVHIVMENGQEFDIPLYDALTLTLDGDIPATAQTFSTIDIRYQINSNINDVTMEVLCSGDVKARLENQYQDRGYIHIQMGETIDEFTKVVVIATNGVRIVMKTITFEQSSIKIIDSSQKTISSDGGTVTLEYLSNVECTVKVSQEGQSWISVLDTKALTAHEIKLRIYPNEGKERSATVKVLYGQQSIAFTITQAKNPEYQDDDISEDGEVKILQHHTKGVGIPFILTGDVFYQDDIDSGHFDRTMNNAMEHIFEVEPYTTFRDYFDVYSVCAVSPYGGRYYETWYGGGTFIDGNHEKVLAEARKAYSDLTEATIMVVLNEAVYAGTCHFWCDSRYGDYSIGSAIAFLPIGYDDKMFGELVHHEFGGHGFAKLNDEYDYPGTVPYSEVQQMENAYWNIGWFLNTETKSDPTKVRWAKFLQDSRYDGLGLGVFEGAGTYQYGLYRSTEDSIMRYNEGEYNPISRETIYKRIHKLGIGIDWQYDYEEFVRYDEVNRKAHTSAYNPVDKDNFVPLHPPVIHIGK